MRVQRISDSPRRARPRFLDRLGPFPYLETNPISRYIDFIHAIDFSVQQLWGGSQYCQRVVRYFAVTAFQTTTES